jgi:hypothetical protein
MLVIKKASGETRGKRKENFPERLISEVKTTIIRKREFLRLPFF